MKLTSLPEKIRTVHNPGISFLCAVGFTKVLLINSPAFSDVALINSTKAGIIVSSIIDDIASFIILKKTLKEN